MDFRLTEEEERFRQKVRDFFDNEIPEERRVITMAQAYREDDPEFFRWLRGKLGERGWLGLGVPREYGGLEAPTMERYIFSWEWGYHGSFFPLTGSRIVAPTLAMHGTEWQKREFLPKILRGEIEFCLGYTEPEAGSDLASLQIRAVPDGDDYVINGQKRFTSGAHRAEYCWLAARTEPDAPKHRGISLFIADMTDPGITVRPLWTMADSRTNEVFWDNVRVPRPHLVGELNQGWTYMTTALTMERISLDDVPRNVRVFEELAKLARETRHNGQSLSKDPMVRNMLAELSAEVTALTLLSHRNAWMVSQGIVPHYEAAMIKAFGSEQLQRLVYAAMKIMGLHGTLQQGSKWTPLFGQFERLRRLMYPAHVGGGSNEVQRNIIAIKGLGLPRG
jgi:alkylation response protein AidB-like acyl-CoA dehydrogenase